MKISRPAVVHLDCCVKVDAERDIDEEKEESMTDETLKTEHQVTDAQQVDAAQGVAGTSDKQQGKEVCMAVTCSLWEPVVCSWTVTIMFWLWAVLSCNYSCNLEDKLLVINRIVVNVYHIWYYFIMWVLFWGLSPISSGAKIPIIIYNCVKWQPSSTVYQKSEWNLVKYR